MAEWSPILNATIDTIIPTFRYKKSFEVTTVCGNSEELSNADVSIFTDGSKMDGRTGALIFSDDRLASTVFQAELVSTTYM